MNELRLSFAAALLLAASAIAAAPAQMMPDRATTRIAAIVARTMDYPPEARPGEEQGVAVVGFTIGDAGTAEAIELVRSSGHATLDSAALRTIARLQDLPREAVGRRTFAVLQYRMTGPGRDPAGVRDLQVAVSTLQQR